MRHWMKMMLPMWMLAHTQPFLYGIDSPLSLQEEYESLEARVHTLTEKESRLQQSIFDLRQAVRLEKEELASSKRLVILDRISMVHQALEEEQTRQRDVILSYSETVPSLSKTAQAALQNYLLSLLVRKPPLDLVNMKLFVHLERVSVTQKNYIEVTASVHLDLFYHLHREMLTPGSMILTFKKKTGLFGGKKKELQFRPRDNNLFVEKWFDDLFLPNSAFSLFLQNALPDLPSLHTNDLRSWISSTHLEPFLEQEEEEQEEEEENYSLTEEALPGECSEPETQSPDLRATMMPEADNISYIF